MPEIETLPDVTSIVSSIVPLALPLLIVIFPEFAAMSVLNVRTTFESKFWLDDPSVGLNEEEMKVVN